MGFFVATMTLAASAAILLVLWEGGREVIRGEISTGIFFSNNLLVHLTAKCTGTLTSFILYTVTVAGGLGGLSSLYGDFMKAVGKHSLS